MATVQAFSYHCAEDFTMKTIYLPTAESLTKAGLLVKEEELFYETENRHRFSPGDVVEIPFPYTDLSGFKTRPALILAVSRTDLTVVFISTHISWMAFEDMLLLPDKNNGLKTISLVRIAKLFSIAPRLIFRKIGQLKTEDLQAALWCARLYFSPPSGDGSAGS